MESYVETKEKCEECGFYLMIDSAYGYCRRFPPLVQRKYKENWRTYTEDRYPIVAFNNSVCGEFKEVKR